MGKVTITYNGAVISEAEETAPVTVRYHGSTIATLGAGENKTLSCGGKYMRSDLIIGSKTLSCGGKKMASDLGLAAEADSVEDDIITYTGTMTDQIVLMSNVAYRLLTLTSSGTLTLSKSRKADVWMVAGGNTEYYDSGGAGGYSKQENGVQIAGNMAAVVGAGAVYAGIEGGFGGLSSFGGVATKAPNTNSISRNGGTGGGTNYMARSSGDGESKYPFGDTGGAAAQNTGNIVAGTDKPHSGGGGGGGVTNLEEDLTYGGGNGGTNGGAGEQGPYDWPSGGRGGNYGGGNGGKGENGTVGSKGESATFYGAGGGAGGVYVKRSGTARNNAGGNGYQGIIYVRIPLDQSIYN